MTDSEDWLILEDPMRAHIAASEPSLDSTLFGADANECLVRSKIMAAAGSTTIDDSGRELFEAKILAFIRATPASKPTGIIAEKSSKLWRIDHATAARTSKVTTQLNRQGGNENMSRHLEQMIEC